MSQDSQLQGGDALDGEEKSGADTHLDNLSRRGTLVSLLGLGSLGVIGSSSGLASAQGRARPWNRDVDAQGHKLFDLGSLTMRANPSAEITDFEGQNLSVDANGVLNAVGGGVVQSGDFLPLMTISNDAGAVAPTSYETITQHHVVPFGSLQNPGYDLYVSVSGAVVGPDNETASVRLFDDTAGTILNGTEVQVTTTGRGPRQDLNWFAFEGPKMPYNPGVVTLFYEQTKSSTGDADFHVQVHVWGKVK